MMTMKKWYFSKKGDVVGPMSLEEAIAYAQQNPDVYGWHPSFVQWRPVTIISELGNIVSNEEPAVNPLDELIEKFKIKKQRLDKKLTIIDQRIADNETHLSTLHSEIAQYKKLTANLSEGVKGAIDKLEQQYLAMREKQARLNEAASIASMEISTLVNEFSDKMSDKGSTTPISSTSVKSKPVEEQTADEFLIDNIDESLLQEVGNTNVVDQEEDNHQPPSRSQKVKLVDVNSVANSDQVKQSEVTRPVAKTISKDVLIDEAMEIDEEADENKKGFDGVKSLFKSVFKADEDQSEIQGNSLSKLLAMEEENKKVAVNQSPVDSNDSTEVTEDDLAKKARRRTRRRR